MRYWWGINFLAEVFEVWSSFSWRKRDLLGVQSFIKLVPLKMILKLMS